MSKLLKSKILLGVMIVAVMFVGAFALSTHSVKADSCTISMTLKQGMRNSEVLCLQQTLSVTPATGYFGTITKAAVMAYQTNHSLTADGVVGPMTRATLATQTVVTPPVSYNYPAGCTSTVGYSSTTGQSCSVLTYPAGCTSTVGYSSTTGQACSNVVSTTLPAGCTSTVGYSSTTGASCATGVIGTTNGTNGALVASQSSAVSYGVTVNAGATANLGAIKLQATSGPVQVTSVDVHMNVRPWLYFSQLILSSNGTTLATLPLTSANVTEITVGSDYLINFSGLNYTVTPGVNPDLILAGTSISGTNKLTTPQTVWSLMTNIKTINGSGWTDSVNGGTLGLYGVGSNSVSLSASGSIAEIYANISANSPATGQIAVSSSSGTTTTNVVLGVFSLESQNTTATINGLTIGLHDDQGNALSTFSNVRLIGPGCTSGCGGLLAFVNGDNNTISFTNLTSPLALNTWTDYTVEADIAGQAQGTVYLTLNPQTGSGAIVGTDSNYDNLTFGTTVVLQTSPLTLTSNSVALSNESITLGSAIVQANYTVGYNFNMVYTLANNSNNYVYVHATPGTAVTPTISGTATFTLGTTFQSVTGTSNLDSSGHYYVLSPNSSRTFTIAGAMYAPTTGNPAVPTSGQYTLTISGTSPHAINYGTGLNGADIATEYPVVSSLYPINFSANF